MKNSKGFTLIEVIIVVAIIGIMTAISIPAISGWLPNYRLKAAARALYGAAMKAKGEAVKRNANCALIFNQGANVYMVFVDSNENCEFDTGETVILREEQWPPSVSLSSVTFTDNDDSKPTIVFQPTAIPTANGGGMANGTATLINTKGRSRDVVINRAGSIRID